MSQVKVVVLGLGAVGKSALTIRFVQNTFVEEYEPTISNTYKKTATVDGKSYSIDILDTAGMECNESLKPVIYRGRDCFVLVYAITDRASFESIKQIHDDILRVKDSEKVPCILCGNKSDLDDSRQVSVEEVQELANSLNAVFLETSALNGNNVEEAMKKAVREYTKTLPQEKEAPKPKKTKWSCILI
ncbi:Ras-like protein rasD [Tritrichomonas foetus]|uniref:Ras-like protein rasD n=1 Tax=Tritrichomonas foetus TaxID=1144522 RepID=A0A1J4JGE4_9EUKA|nr:Ras-like protein rasD [Tritrichomonas foetus]|eukprot:OHS96276.1 Ras-like protein rasD [Tritrichomonas foetus]